MPNVATSRTALLVDLLWIGLAVGLASVGLKAFLLPNGFMDGGVTGIALLLEVLFEVPLSLGLVLLSVPFLVLAYFTVSRRVMWKSVFAIATLAAVLEFEHFEPVTDDKLLIAIFGGLCLGAGIGTAIRSGAVLDGSEIMGIFINNRFGISIGKVILVFNVLLFSVTALVLSIEVALYSILTYLVTAKVTDTIIKGFEDFIGVTIVSSAHELIRVTVLRELGAGLTLYHGQGGYGATGVGEPQPIIHTVVNRIDIRRLYRLIEECDAGAFVVEFDVNHVRGGVLRRYLERGERRVLKD